MTEQTTQPAADDSADLRADPPPPHWEADIVAADGGTVHLRPICPDDDEGLTGLMDRTATRPATTGSSGP